MNNITLPNTKVILQENGGPSKARNVGVLASSGKYILPLDSDDVILPEYIASCVKIIDSTDTEKSST